MNSEHGKGPMLDAVCVHCGQQGALVAAVVMQSLTDGALSTSVCL